MARSPSTPATWSSASTAARSCSTTGCRARCGTSTRQEPTRLDNWEAFTQRDRKDRRNPDKQNNNHGDRRPPKAKPDQFGARPGRTTVLHPLDNDSAPTGRVLSIRSVDQVSGGGAELTISPDGQTVQIRLPDATSRQTRFEYFVDDGRSNVSAHATVTVTHSDRGPEPAAQPAPGLQAARVAGAAGGAVACRCSPTGGTDATATR